MNISFIYRRVCCPKPPLYSSSVFLAFFFAFFVRAFTPLSAIARRSSADSAENPLGTLAFPPFFPPSLPSSTAAGFFFFATLARYHKPLYRQSTIKRFILVPGVFTMLKDEIPAITAGTERIAAIRAEIKTISGEPILPESLFSVTLNYKQFVQVLGALLRGAHVAESRAALLPESPTLRKYAQMDYEKIAAALAIFENLPAAAIRIEEEV
jgi:hypothetical protein